MKGKKVFYIVLTLICMSPFMVKADCDYQRLAELSKLASNVKLSYNYQFIDYYPQFTITATNLTNDIYMIDNYGTRFSAVGEVSSVYKDGNKLRFTFYSNDPSCLGREISTKYVNLPEFNPRYNSDECKAYPNFSLCQMWTDTSFSNKQFENELANYEEELEEEDNVHKQEVSVWSVILEFLLNNAFGFAIFGVIVLILVGMLIYNRFKGRR